MSSSTPASSIGPGWVAYPRRWPSTLTTWPPQPTGPTQYGPVGSSPPTGSMGEAAITVYLMFCASLLAIKTVKIPREIFNSDSLTNGSALKTILYL